MKQPCFCVHENNQPGIIGVEYLFSELTKRQCWIWCHWMSRTIFQSSNLVAISIKPCRAEFYRTLIRTPSLYCLCFFEELFVQFSTLLLPSWFVFFVLYTTTYSNYGNQVGKGKIITIIGLKKQKKCCWNSFCTYYFFDCCVILHHYGKRVKRTKNSEEN
jgi:hypothetical protein